MDDTDPYCWLGICEGDEANGHEKTKDLHGDKPGRTSQQVLSCSWTNTLYTPFPVVYPSLYI